MNCSGIGKHIRKAHAAEIFRSAFSRSQGANSLSTNDLDDLVKQYKVRPSLMVGAAETVGSLVGASCRYMPSSLANFVTSAVDEAVQISFNDSLREVTVEDEEVKEAFKFHRDLSAASEKVHISGTLGQAQTALVGALGVVINVAEKL